MKKINGLPAFVLFVGILSCSVPSGNNAPFVGSWTRNGDNGRPYTEILEFQSDGTYQIAGHYDDDESELAGAYGTYAFNDNSITYTRSDGIVATESYRLDVTSEILYLDNGVEERAWSKVP